MGLSARQWASVRHAVGVVNIWDGAMRAGKTTAANLAWLNYVRTAPPGQLAILGKTLDTIRRNVLVPLKALHPQAVTYRRASTHCVILGREIELIGYSDATAEERVRGVTLVGAYVDELTLMDELMFQSVLGRLSGDNSRLFGTTNPDNPGHWLKRAIDRAIRGELPGWRVWKFTMDDNPSLSEDRKARYRRELTGLWYRRFYLGEWVAAEGAVFHDWNPATMVVPWASLPPMQRLLGMGVDYATTTVTAGLVLGVGMDSRLYLVDEWRHDGRIGGRWTAQKQVHALAEFMEERPHLPFNDGRDEPPIEWVIVDPSATPLAAEMEAQGFRRLQAADNRVLHGVQLMAGLLSTDRLKISSKCTGFIEEAPGYSWDEKQSAAGKDAVIKTADHSLDGGRYAIATTQHTWRGMVRAA